MHNININSPREECGVFGFYDNNGFDVASMIYLGLFALQHRGQESCGMAINDDNHINQHKDVGLVSEVFSKDTLSRLKGTIGIGHVRYSVYGSNTREDAQPLVSRYIKGTLSMAHNGSLVNSAKLTQKLKERGAIFQTSSDVEVIMHLAAIERTKTPSIERALENVMSIIQGAYSLVVMSPRKLIGIRDPQGFRPLCIGKLKDSYILASETCALDVIKAEFVRDVEPGEIVIIDHNGIRSIKTHCGQHKSLCIFEYIYFARPDSKIDGIPVHNSRVLAGRLLAKAHPVEADMVIGVPDSGLNAAEGFSQQSGIPYGYGLVKNKYIGRTFINPSQSDRVESVNIKLNVLKSNIEGKRLVIVDDSIVRGTTCANIIRMLKDAGAVEVHMRVSAPPFLWPCYFGTDIPSKKNLIACHNSVEEIRQLIGADSLGFLPADQVKFLCGKDNGYCDACFSGKYPITISHLTE